MKRMNYKRKLISYFVIWSVILSSLLLYSPEDIVHSATGVPEINIVTPDAVGAVFNVPTVEFTGEISDDLTSPDELSVKVFEQLSDVEQPLDITDTGKLIITSEEQSADFSFTKEFSEGPHTITFVVTDEDGVSTKLDQSFTVMPAEKEENAEQETSEQEISENEAINQVQPSTEKINISQLSAEETTKRPYMAKMYLIPIDAVDDYMPGKDAPSSYLPAEDMTRVPLNYKILIDVRSNDALTETQPLITLFGDITGKEKLERTTKITDEISSYIYTFTPDKQFDSGTSYYIYLNPKFSNVSGEEIIPRFLKFTTVSGNYENYQFDADKGNQVREKDYIHGPFSNVTNACAFCHSTHNGTSPTLEGGKYGSNGNDLCLACHDGTNGSPKLENSNLENEHNKDTSVACSSCHNPHTPGSKENPTSMHSNAGSDANVNPFFTYKKASTATGVSSDFSLCLSCHNGKTVDEKSGELISDIQQYYQNDALTGQSGHNIVATDDSGSSLNGQLPCAECHETHGSSNMKMLRQQLGNIQSDVDAKFTKASGEWDASSQRDFCLSCHNGKTVLYGKTGNAIYDKITEKSLDPNNSGHDKNSEQLCSECHSNNNSFVEAAHAPKGGETP
ncbi:cytochrome c3 family protein [Neobacillus jeddahensis]|uniref:cytochrome c3 family protein n=1 Tax=Neobacillus jeddahensis TaxID=1461580 RepID=UPI0005915A93|nr:cytochrome c3 family protein [Neobacillus jeddahensis]